jgi:hypothetical protein
MTTSLGRNAMDALREKIPGEEFDYRSLMDAFRGYVRPRSKVTSLLKAGDLVRIKKGIYIFGPRYRRRPYSREILANLLYGPSCLSLDYALHYHGLIPEQVETLTSVTTGRSRTFSTPVGVFSFAHVPMGVFRLGVERIKLTGGEGFLIATPERALADRVYQERGLSVAGRKKMEEYLLKNLRLDVERVRSMDAGIIDLCGKRYGSRKVTLLGSLVRKLTGKGHE